ncbi:hypothetical protein J3R83DRAFT_5202 [Lanmaoa asiatica]|nr:hypothetical protein J3R83DRAFT_5202 [Lanmaoa asiatica]
MRVAGVPIQGVLFTVFQSIFQVFLLCLAGFMLSFKGIVDKPTSKVCLNISLLTLLNLFRSSITLISLFSHPLSCFQKSPFSSHQACLIISPTTLLIPLPAKLRQLWVIPIFFMVVTGLSAVIAHWLARTFRLKRSQVNFATAASMFMNSNSLPVALMQSLATTVPLLKWGPDDTIDAMFGRSLTYLVVFSTFGMILRWSYGIHLISQADEPELATPPPTTYRDADNADEHPAPTHATVGPPTTAQLVDYETETNIDPRDRMPWRTRPLRSRLPHPHLSPASWHHTRPPRHVRSHIQAVPTSLGDQSETDDSDEPETTEGDSEETIVLRSEPIDTGFSTEAEDLAPVPEPASLSSSSSSELDAHSTPAMEPTNPSLPSLPLYTAPQHIRFPLPTPHRFPSFPRLLKSEEMIPLRGALDNAGGCSIPVTLIVLGGWFWDGGSKPNTKGRHAEGEAKLRAKALKNTTVTVTATAPVFGEQQGHVHASTTDNTVPCLGHQVTPHSRDSSATSLSSLIGTFGDVLMARVHPRGGSGRARWRVRGSIGANKADVEPGLLTTPIETENGIAENGHGRPSRSRPQTDLVKAHARLSSVSSSSLLPAPKSPHARGTNSPGETLTIFVTLLARMVIVPLVVTPMMVLVSQLGWGGEVFEDPVFIVSSMLLISSPPALTLAQISQQAKKASGADTNAEAFSPFERLLSRTVFWAYCVLTPPVTIASVMVGLLLIGA